MQTPSVLVPGDGFFAMIKKGYIRPWVPQAHRQNEVVIEAAGAAAGRLTDTYFVVYDGVVGPWFLSTFARAAGLAHLHYVILLPPLVVCLRRVRRRVDHGFTDPAITREIYDQFANAAVESRHLITLSNDHPGELAELIAGGLNENQFRYTAH